MNEQRIAERVVGRVTKRTAINKISISIDTTEHQTFVVEVESYRPHELIDQREFQFWIDETNGVIGDLGKLLRDNDYTTRPGVIPPRVNLKERICFATLEVYKNGMPPGNWLKELYALVKESPQGRYLK